MQPVFCRTVRGLFPAVRAMVFALVVCACALYAQVAVPDSQPLNWLLELHRSDAQQADLLNLLRAQRTPGSGQYHQWLTPEQFAARFAPDEETRNSALLWLQQQGMQGGTVSRNGMRITFCGTAAQVQRSFGVRLQAHSVADLQAGKLTVLERATIPLPATLSLNQADETTRSNNDAALIDAVEANTAAAVVVEPSATDASAIQTRRELLAEAAAQGITVVQRGGTATDNGDGSVAALVSAPGAAIPPDPQSLRPEWQSASGLPGNSLRAVPDAVADADALATDLAGYAAQHGRLGEIAPWLYRFAGDASIFTHPSASAVSQDWTAGDGLGALNVTAFLRAVAAAEAGTVVTLNVSSTSLTHGQTLKLPVTVSTNGGQPSGTVTVTLKGRSGNSVTLGPTAIASDGNGAYVANFSTNALPGDIYDISASYNSGTGTTASNTVTTTVLPENVALTATAPATTLGATIPVTVTATSPSGVGVPSGAVTVTTYNSDGSSNKYTGTLPSSTTSSASVVVNVPATIVGMVTDLANCTTNASFACNQPQSFTVNVSQATPTVTLTSTPEATVANSATQKYDLAVTVSAPAGSTGLAAPTGSVAIQDSGTPVTTITLNKGSGTYTVSLSGTGHSLTAMYSGDGNYAAATSAAVPVNGQLISTTTALTASPTSITFGSSTSLTATVTPAAYAASGAPTGTVTFRDSVQGVVGTGTLAMGYVTVPIATLTVGTHTITASYPGDNNYAMSVSTAVTVTVAPGKLATTTTLSIYPAQPLAGQNTLLEAIVTPTNTALASGSYAVTCTGQVTFFSNNAFVANGTLGLGGAVRVNARLSGGSNSLTAVYGGDTQCYGSTSTPVSVTPQRIASVIAVQPSVTYANAGQTIQLTATVSSADTTLLGTPTGTVTFYASRGGVLSAIGTATLAASGASTAIAVLNVNGSSAGQQGFSAGYAGDTIFLPATSGTISVSFGDFSVAINPTSLTITRGASGTAQAALTVTNGFTGTVILSCTPPASSQITCGFGPSTLAGGGASTLTIATTASSAKIMHAGIAGLLTGTGSALAALLLLPFARTRRLAGVLLLACCCALAAGGCSLGTVDSTNNLNGGGSGSAGGSGSGSTGTPLGTQLLTVTASSGDGTLRHNYTYPVTVQ